MLNLCHALSQYTLVSQRCEEKLAERYAIIGNDVLTIANYTSLSLRASLLILTRSLPHHFLTNIINMHKLELKSLRPYQFNCNFQITNINV